VPPLSVGALIEQGYLVVQNPPMVRVEVRLRRVNETECFVTIKSGIAPTRVEVETGITLDQFSQLWPLTEGRRVLKRRHRIPIGRGHIAELDVYQGPRLGLQTVEVEFSSAPEANAFSPPPWFDREVTGDERYANVELAG